MSQVNPTPVTSCILPERLSPVRRVTMGSLQVPQAARLAELARLRARLADLEKDGR